MNKVITFARSINIEYLDKFVELLHNGLTGDELKRKFNEFLSIYIGSATNIRKTREIIYHAYVYPSGELGRVKDKAIELLKTAKGKNRMAIHYVVLNAMFSAFNDYCSIVGKLSEVQETIIASQIERKICEEWGERTTLLTALTRYSKTLKDFGIISQIKIGTFKINKIKITNPDLLGLFVFAHLISKEKLYSTLDRTNSIPEYFPFEYYIDLLDIEKTAYLKLDRIGGELVVSV